MIELIKAKSEADFLTAMELERRICALDGHARWHYHIGGLVFDRFMFEGGAPDFFDFGHLVLLDGEPVGFALCYFDEGDCNIELLNEYRSLYSEVIPLVDALFGDREFSTTVNSLDVEHVAALKGYTDDGEDSFCAFIDLENYQLHEVNFITETIRPLERDDISDRARYGDIPTARPLSEELYRGLMDSPYYGMTLDYVIIDRASGGFAGFLTWWLDPKSRTALLEPVACLPDFRRRGIMTRALKFGLNELKRRGFSAAYVSTSIRNLPAQALYQSVGFKKSGTANSYTKNAARES